MILSVRSVCLAGGAFVYAIVFSNTGIAQQDNTSFLTATDANAGLSIEAQSRGTFSDNILRFSDIEEEQLRLEDPDLSLSDYIFDVGGNLTYRKRLGRNVLSLDAGVGYRFHTNNTILDNERFDGTALFAWQLGGRCRGSFGGTWARALAQFETVEDIADNTLTRLSGGGQATCNLINSLQVTGSAVFSSADNSSAIREQNDFNNEAYTTSLRYAFGRGSYVGAFYQYTDTSFTSAAPGVNPNSGFTTQVVGGELGLVFGRAISILGSFGAISVDGEGGFDEQDTDLDGVSGRVTATVPIGANQRLEFSAFQDVRTQESIEAAVARLRGAGFAWSANWSPRLSSQFNITYEDRTIVQDDDVLVPVSDDETLQYNLSVDYRLGRLITLSLQGRIADRNATDDSFDFVENAIIFGINVNFN